MNRAKKVVGGVVGTVIAIGIVGSMTGTDGDSGSNKEALGSSTSPVRDPFEPSTPMPTAPPVSELPIFEGHNGDDVIALVDKLGLISAKVLGKRPDSCFVPAWKIVRWDATSAKYVDTGRDPFDEAGLRPPFPLTETFSGPVGVGDASGYVFHADVGLRPPFPDAVVTSLACTY